MGGTPYFDQVRKTAPTNLTISGGGAITVVQELHTVTAGGGAPDNLDSILKDTLDDGDELLLILAPGSFVVTIKHLTGNITCPNGQDVVLTAGVTDAVRLRFFGLTWRIIAFGALADDAGGIGRALSLTTTGNGASLVGIEDTGGKYTGTEVEAALSEAATTAFLASNTTAEGASSIGIEDTGGKYTGTEVEAALSEAATTAFLASASNGEGASTVGIEDTGGKYTGTEVEAALSEAATTAFLTSNDNGKGASSIGIEDLGDDYAGITVEAAVAELGPNRPDKVIVDPGDAAAIPVTDSGNVAMVSGVGGQTRTLARPTFKGQRLAIFMDTDGGGAIVIVPTGGFDQTVNTTLTFADAGDYIALEGITVGATLTWRTVANNGVGLS